MRSTRGSAPDPNHTSSMARSSAPMRLRSRPLSAPASASPQQSSRAILPVVDRVTLRATASGNIRLPAQQPKLLDRLREALHACEYSPRPEQGYRHTMLPAAARTARCGSGCSRPMLELLSNVPHHIERAATGDGDRWLPLMGRVRRPRTEIGTYEPDTGREP